MAHLRSGWAGWGPKGGGAPKARGERGELSISAKAHRGERRPQNFKLFVPFSPPLPFSLFFSLGILLVEVCHGWRPWTSQIVRLDFSEIIVYEPQRLTDRERGLGEGSVGGSDLK